MQSDKPFDGINIVVTSGLKEGEKVRGTKVIKN